MTARGSRFLWSIALCLWLLGGPALAQPIWDVVEDKDGLALASRLLEADTATSETFQKLIMNQPGLTRRAFVVAVLQAAKLDASDPKSSQAFSSLAVRLATDIGQLFGDPEPLAVLNDIITRNPESDSRLLAYWDRHRANKRPLANDNDEDDRYWESPAFPSGIDEKTHIDILIKDTGHGIPSSKHNAIFRPGFTTKQRGWGLGLSLAKRIIENYHKGKIFVKESKIGEGTTFCIQLPVYQA